MPPVVGAPFGGQHIVLCVRFKDSWNVHHTVISFSSESRRMIDFGNKMVYFSTNYSVDKSEEAMMFNVLIELEKFKQESQLIGTHDQILYRCNGSELYKKSIELGKQQPQQKGQLN